MTLTNKVGQICLRQIMENLIVTEYVEGRNKMRKTEDSSLSFKEMLLRIPRNSISVKKEIAQGSTDICWLNQRNGHYCNCYRRKKTKLSLVILQGECESKMMYSLNKEVYDLTVQYNTNNPVSYIYLYRYVFEHVSVIFLENSESMHVLNLRV